MNDNDPPPAYIDDDLPTYTDAVRIISRSSSPQPPPSLSSGSHHPTINQHRSRADTIITISDTESHRSHRRSPMRPNVRILTQQLSVRSGVPGQISVRKEIFESLLGYMALLIFVFCCVILFRFIKVLQEAKAARGGY